MVYAKRSDKNFLCSLAKMWGISATIWGIIATLIPENISIATRRRMYCVHYLLHYLFLLNNCRSLLMMQEKNSSKKA